MIVQIGNLKKGLNPLSVSDMVFTSPYMSTAVKTGFITGIIGLAVSLTPKHPIIRIFARFVNAEYTILYISSYTNIELNVENFFLLLLLL